MKPHFLVLLLAVLISGCDYKLEKTVVTNIQQPPLDEFSINLNSYPSGSIELKQLTTFTYSVNIGDRPVSQVGIKVDGSMLGVTILNNNSFSVDPAVLSTGSHTLEIGIVAQSGTGSLADLAGAEFITVLLERILVVDHTIPTDPDDPNSVKITSIENVNGTLKITWNPYDNFNFQSYTINRVDYDDELDPSHATQYVTVATITDATGTSVNDQYFLYGRSVYTITLTADGKTFTSPPVEYEYDFKQAITGELDIKGNLKLKWTSIKKFINNINNYHVILDGPLIPTPLPTYDIYSATDTTLEVSVDAILGYQVRARLFTNTGGTSKIVEVYVNTGDPFPNFDTNNGVHFDETTASYYLVSTNQRIWKVDDQGTPVDSTADTYDRVVYARNLPFAVATKNEKSFKIDLITMSSTALPDVPDLTPLSVSDNLRIAGFHKQNFVTLSGTYTQAGDTLFCCDATGQKDGYVTPDGAYTVMADRIYKNSGIKSDYYGQFDTYGRLSTMFIDDPPVVTMADLNRIYKYNLETKTEVFSKSDVTGPCNYDPVSDKLGCTRKNSNMFVILNANDLSVYKTLPVYPVSFQPTDQTHTFYYLWNGNIICPKAQVKLSDIP
jgi:hypothetical protein